MATAGVSTAAESGRLNEVATLINEADNALTNLRALDEQASHVEDVKKQAFFYKDSVKPAMGALRKPCDQLELLVDKAMWPFPTYEDILFNA